MVVGAGDGGAARSGMFVGGGQDAAVVDAGGAVGSAANGSHITRLTDMHVLQHDIADGGIGAGGEEGFVEPTDNRIGAVGLGLRRHGAGEGGDTRGKTRSVDVLRNDISATGICYLAQRCDIFRPHSHRQQGHQKGQGAEQSTLYVGVFLHIL